MFEGLFGAKKYKSISGQEVKAKLDGKEKFLLFDVRSPEEYSGGHIEHSISLPLQAVPSSIARYARSKESEIVVYCQSGARSARAAGTLAEMGYTNVRNLGGISSWSYGIVR
ncbi:MAG: rhodanese-like domain-containing protein [Eubacteriales bacterium]